MCSSLYVVLQLLPGNDVVTFPSTYKFECAFEICGPPLFEIDLFIASRISVIELF